MGSTDHWSVSGVEGVSVNCIKSVWSLCAWGKGGGVSRGGGGGNVEGCSHA